VHKTRPTQNKRQRERAQADKRKEKAEKRQQSKARRSATGPRPEGEDPDIAGIRPGPQRSPYDEMIGTIPVPAAEEDTVDE
jgi:hypothetical protein